MFVTKDVDEKFIGNFMKKKHPALSQLIGKPETSYLYFSSADFQALINTIAAVTDSAGIPAVGLRIYFASYTTTGVPAINNLVNAGYNNLLTLIFVPTGDKDGAGNYNDLGSQYFMIDPVNGGVISFSQADAVILRNNYLNNKRPLLQQIITDAGAGASVRETVSLWIAITAFTDAARGFLSEMNCQGAKGITAYISSHGKGDVFPDGTNTPIDWQLSLVFCLATQITYTDGKTYTYHFDIDDTSDYTHRETLPASRTKGGGDTLNPCPPATVNCSNP